MVAFLYLQKTSPNRVFDEREAQLLLLHPSHCTPLLCQIFNAHNKAAYRTKSGPNNVLDPPITQKKNGARLKLSLLPVHRPELLELAARAG